eukprot:g31742.t1
MGRTVRLVKRLKHLKAKRPKHPRTKLGDGSNHTAADDPTDEFTSDFGPCFLLLPASREEKRYVECEEDAPEETRELVPPGTFSSSWSLATLNVMVTAEGRVLVPLTDAGLGQLLCGAKATAGLKRGRYLFEVKVLEIRSSGGARASSGEGRRRPKQLVALGFATRSAPLFLGDGDQSIGFDTDGCFIVNGRKSWIDGINDRITDRQLVLGVVLNLLPDSPNSNTLSLFVNGVRMGKPQALPEELKDKTLYPTMNFKNVTLHANFSTQPFAPLVFACRTLQEAAKDAARRVFGRAGCSGIGVQIGSMKLDIAGANDTRVSLGRTELR